MGPRDGWARRDCLVDLWAPRLSSWLGEGRGTRKGVQASAPRVQLRPMVKQLTKLELGLPRGREIL